MTGAISSYLSIGLICDALGFDKAFGRAGQDCIGQKQCACMSEGGEEGQQDAAGLMRAPNRT